jgi:copper homeostasis protein CutC
MLHLKIKINRALDDLYEEHLQRLLRRDISPVLTSHQRSQSLEDFQVLDQLIFSRPQGVSLRSYARLRSIKASLLLDSEADSQSVAHDMFRYTEYELRLATVGAAELRAVMIRLSAPVAGLMAKSGLLGGS